MDEYPYFTDDILPESTKMAMPETSYSQDILNQPIPFENRLLFLSEYSRFNALPVSRTGIKKQLQLTTAQLDTMIDYLKPDVTHVASNGEIEYVAGTLEVVQEERDWMLSYDRLDEYLSTKSIAAHLSKKPVWVAHRTNELGIFPQKMIMPSKRTGMGFEKTVILPLRHWILHHPPAGDWLSQKQLMEGLGGKHQDWVRARIEELGIASQRRIAYGHNTPTPHYEPEALTQLLKYIKELSEPAGNWLTAGTMHVMLGRDRRWVLKRLRQYEYLAKLKMDDFGREAIHYPSFVLDILKDLSINGH